MSKLYLASLMLSTTSLFAVATPVAGAAPSTQEIEYNTKDPKELKDLKDSAAVSDSFVKLIDAGDYAKAWDAGSAYFKAAITQDEWNKTMETVRKPLGKEVKREIGDQRTAKDPANLPKGDYMVMFYRSGFANKEHAYELVTLVKEDGEWKVLTYQVN